MHARDHGFGQRDDALHQAGAEGEQRLVRFTGWRGAHLPHVVAGAEGRAGGGDDDDVDRGVGGDGAEFKIQRPHQLPRQRVALPRTIERQRGDARLVVTKQNGDAHQSNISTVRATSPAFIARNASFMSPSTPRREIIESRSSRPCR